MGFVLFFFPDLPALNLPIPFFVPITLSTHFPSYISYNEPNIPNMHSHTHYLTQESNKDPLMVGSTLLRKLWGLTFQFSSDMLPTRHLWLNHFYFLEGNGNPLQGKSLPGKSHGQRSLVGCSPWGLQESDTTERLHFHFSLSCIGEGKGSPLQCSCLENPRDGGAWWAAVYGVAQSRTRLKRLSSSMCLERVKDSVSAK